MVRTSDGTTVNRAAVVVADGRALLAVQRAHAHHEPPSVQIIATLDDVTVEAQRREAVITAADGQTWTVGQGDGCGCRSPLSEWLRLQLRQGVGT